MKPVVLLRAAQADVRRAAQFYGGEASRLGRDFLTIIEHALSLLEENREMGSPLRSGFRKLVVRRFPYLIIYRAEDNRVLVPAVGNQRRHPDFWLSRSDTPA